MKMKYFFFLLLAVVLSAFITYEIALSRPFHVIINDEPVSKSLNYETVWDPKTQTLRIRQKGSTELQAIETTKKYLSLIERFYDYEKNEVVKDEEWEDVLSQAAINSPYGIDGRVYRPMVGQMGSSVRRLTDGIIICSKVFSDQTDDVSKIVVTGQYVFNDPTAPEPFGGKRQYLKNYYFIEENGHIVLDKEEIIQETLIK